MDLANEVFGFDGNVHDLFSQLPHVPFQSIIEENKLNAAYTHFLS